MKIKDDIVLEIVKCDILDQEVDAIVNPVDPELSFQEGLSRNTMSKAGQALQ